MRRFFLTIIFFFAFAHFSLSQADSLLGHFSLQKLQSTVILNWTLRSGSTCNGIQIFRSEDSMQFVQIGDIQGVCGSSGTSVDYLFEDTAPLNDKTNYYKLQLGTNGFSKVLAIKIIKIPPNGSTVRPNPVAEFMDVYFSNPNSLSMSFVLYDFFGQEVFRKDNLNGEHLHFERSGTISGIYTYMIVYEDEIHSIGKIILL